MKQYRLVFLGIPILMVIAACTSTDSTYIDTAGMYANFEAEASGDGTTDVRGSLRQNGVHSTSFIDLEGGDLLRAVRVSNSDEEVMRENQIFGATWYTANFPTQQKNAEFRIEYERAEKVSAMNSVASIPVPFDLDTVNDSFNHVAPPLYRYSADAFNVTWTDISDPDLLPAFEAGDELSFRVTGACIQAAQGSIAWDDQTNPKTVVQLNDFLLDSDPSNPQDCSITVEITLARYDGTVDPAFADGIFVGKQTRTMTFDSVAAAAP